ncbi:MULTISPECIES: hypothetical protein [Sphingobium]|uniref:Uncharacterized protein n=1 Tax=Sphingobium cupriresistens LL01 TaxID=1420583 RepID=A0A0J7Y4P9_9SPHN|nr:MULTISPECIES: hypothetical protein [Sphingobium]KMS58849.1 hypothetical protein V473_09715 [Sphingobium cupriresistens LL01]MBJ7377624.1 hypothetical protein [Sphingobium sp.]WCP11823.1 hypothetical protein sphantq_00214 [Sphingobium sp. AntQ-1]
MVAIILSASIVAAIGLQAAPSVSTVDLFCRGRGDRFVTTQIKVRQSDGTMKNQSNSRRVPFDDAIRIKVAGDSGEALIPDAMLGDDDQRGWHEIKKLEVTPSMIAGKVYFGWLFSPVMSLNRETGTLRITGSLANFSGSCTPYTGQSMARVPRAASARVAGSAPMPAGGDARASARAAAERAGSRDAARSAAVKADLAFRLFNASSESIVEFAMMGASGTPSANWFRTSGPLAANLFRQMNFSTGTTCTHTVRVTFAGGGRTTRPINFCGKNILYVSNDDIWIE